MSGKKFTIISLTSINAVPRILTTIFVAESMWKASADSARGCKWIYEFSRKNLSGGNKHSEIIFFNKQKSELSRAIIQIEKTFFYR